MLPHRAILANIARLRAVIDFSVDDKVLNALPVFHSFGLTAGAAAAGAHRCQLFPTRRRSLPGHPRAGLTTGTAVLSGHLHLPSPITPASPIPDYRLRYVVAGAEKLSEAVRNTWFEKFGIRIFEGYGATETAPCWR